MIIVIIMIYNKIYGWEYRGLICKVDKINLIPRKKAETPANAIHN